MGSLEEELQISQELIWPLSSHPGFCLSICLRNMKDFAFLMIQSGFNGKSLNSTANTFCKEDGAVPAQPS